MITPWTKWRINSAVEEGRPLPPALARKVRRYPDCRRFYEASLHMAKHLREDAVQIVRLEQGRLEKTKPLETLQADTVPLSRRPGRLRPALTMATAAAAIGLALGAAVWWWPPLRSQPDANPPVAAAGSDVTELAHIIRQIKDDVDRVAERKGPQLQQVMARSEAALRAPIVREADNVASDTREILRAFSSLIPLGGRPRRSHPDNGAPSPNSSRRGGPPSGEDAVLACSCTPAWTRL